MICKSGADCIIDKSIETRYGNFHLKSGSVLDIKKLDFDTLRIKLTNEGMLQADSIGIKVTLSTITNQGTLALKDGIIVAPAQNMPLSSLGIIENRGTISANGAFATIKDKGYLTVLFNYGTINGHIDVQNGGALGGINNYGTMNGIILSANKVGNAQYDPTSINNHGVINTISGKNFHFGGNGTFSIENYALKVTKTAELFNSFNGKPTDNSHIVVGDTAKAQFESGGKLILGLGGNFEYDTEYSLSKLVVDTSGNSVLGVDLAHLELLNKDIFTLMQSGDNFIVSLGGSGGGSGITTPITATSKANISTMNNMFLTSNAIISSNKHKAKFRKMANLKNPIYERILDSRSLNANNVDLLDSNTLDSHSLIAIDSLQSNESFFYNSNSPYLTDARGKAIKSVRQQNEAKTQDSPQNSQTNPSDSSDKYNFIFTPFINHTYFYESGNYSISGLDGGFITAFSGKLDESNTLGTHFAFGYGSLSDKNDKDFNIASANLMLGLNYRLDLIYDMFLKARGDFYYFINEVSSSSIAKSKPNNAGFGLSVGYGKDFDFDKWGVLSVEGTLDYKMLSTSDINVKYALDNSTAESYNKAFYNLLYLDLGLNYYKYFSTDLGLWGLDSGLGIRGNLTPKISKGTLMVGNRSVDISLDNDNVLGYLNIGGSYVLQSTNFNMEFTLRYNGSFGDKAISNGGSLEWRVWW